MAYKFSCPIHGTPEGVRIAAVTAVSEDEVKVSIECMTCPEHLATQIHLPSECLAKWDLPPCGTNIYSSLRDHLSDMPDDKEC